LYWWWAIL